MLRRHALLQVWPQEFAWTTASLPKCLEARNQHLASSEELHDEPMFCLETCLCLLYWSSLVYDWAPEASTAAVRCSTCHACGTLCAAQRHAVRGSGCRLALPGTAAAYCSVIAAPQDAGNHLDMSFALGLLRLEGWEELWDPAVDMRALIGWGGEGGDGGGQIVIAFRGTASFENIKTDLKVRGEASVWRVP